MRTAVTALGLLTILLTFTSPSFAGSGPTPCHEALSPEDFAHRLGKFQKCIGTCGLFKDVAYLSAQAVLENGNVTQVLDFFENDNLERFFSAFPAHFYQLMQRDKLGLTPNTMLIVSHGEQFSNTANGLKTHSLLFRLFADVDNQIKNVPAKDNIRWAKFKKRYSEQKQELCSQFSTDLETARDLAADIQAADSSAGASAFVTRHFNRHYLRFTASTQPELFIGSIGRIKAWLGVSKVIATKALEQGVPSKYNVRDIEALGESAAKFIVEQLKFITNKRKDVQKLINAVNANLQASSNGRALIENSMYWTAFEAEIAGVPEFVQQLLNAPKSMEQGLTLTSSATPGESVSDKNAFIKAEYARQLEQVEAEFLGALRQAVRDNDLLAAQALLAEGTASPDALRTEAGQPLILSADSAEMMRLLFI